VRADGTCPTCGDPVETPSLRGNGRRWSWRAIPCHMKLLIAVFAIYLTYRLGQGIAWLVGRF
jgi:hypothetical protein